MKENIFLVGFSGTGKTSTGKVLAKRLGYEYIDTDLQIEANTGRPVPEIFAQEGEAAFRKMETAVLEEICKQDFQVVATGGGLVLSKDNRTNMTANGYVFCLEARIETIYVRLMLDSSVRPLLQGGDPFARITALKSQRQLWYVESDWIVQTDFLTPEEVAEEIERALPIVNRRNSKNPRGATSPGQRAKTDAMYYSPESEPNNLTIKTSGDPYTVVFAPDLLDRLGDLVKEHIAGSAGRKVFIITDDRIGQIYGERAVSALAKAGYRPSLLVVPAGEQSKSLEQATQLYQKLAENRAERKDIIVAIGGGVIGDLGGFVAASWLRGIDLVHVPTTLLAMVDSSIGGKTAVNLPQGKNLVGAVYPPRLVISDVTMLASLPPRERKSGWAEVIKHAIIPGADPDEQGALRRFHNLELNLPKLLANDPITTAAILRESVAVKAGVVERDERESDLRMTLNYGHTYAHALEAAGDYQTLLHGEAVAIGMHGVALLSHRMGLCDAAFVEQQKKMLQAFGLPLKAKVDIEKVLPAMGMDKKSEGGSIRWIIPLGMGKVEIRRDIPQELVREVLPELIG